MADTLRVNEIFTSIQGEGFHSGQLSTFVRLWGCNSKREGLECLHWCDTKYSWKQDDQIFNSDQYAEWKANDLFEELSRGKLPIIFTGGEPMIQLERHWERVYKLAWDLPVAVETNGTIDIPPSIVWITCSPKPPKYQIVPKWVNEVKLVVTPNLIADIDNLRRITSQIEEHTDTPHGPRSLYLQPCDNDLDLARAIVGVIPMFPKWHLGLQLHKILGVR